MKAFDETYFRQYQLFEVIDKHSAVRKHVHNGFGDVMMVLTKSKWNIFIDN